MSEHHTVSRRSEAPSITRSVQVVYALVALSALSLILTVIMADQIVESFEADNPGVTAPNPILTAVISFVLFGALMLFLAFKLRGGAGWARVVLTILAVLAVLSGALNLAQGQDALFLVVGVISLVLDVALLFFMWQKDSSQYLASQRT